MGVPVFFKWLSMRNPKIIIDAQQPQAEDFSSGNPNIDNFYVDMNGLIHPSVNPKGENIKVPRDFEEQCDNIFLYMDKVMNMVRPRKFLYLAIDGVAPRAKMNQQRSRRFRAAMEGYDSQLEKQKLFQEYRQMGIVTPEVEEYVTRSGFDSNLITPGTQFLNDVCGRMRVYIKERLASHRLWKNLIVVFSDANCPGQGEHKIMEYIRQERASPGYCPNQSHCIYGADADLIMLALATHEPRFFIIREVVVTANDKWCTSCGKKGHFFTDCTIADSIEAQSKAIEQQNAASIGVTFQFVKIKAVREFLHVHYCNCTYSSRLHYQLERIIDDFVFLCFFVGNDFLPHVPCLSIRDGGIDVLMRVYELCLKTMPDYISHTGDLNMRSLQIFLRELSSYEEDLVSELINKETYQKQRENFEKTVKPTITDLETGQKKKGIEQFESSIDPHDMLGSFKEEVKKRLEKEQNLENYSVFSHELYSYKEKYYSEKFRIQPAEFLQLKGSVSSSYVQALQWICKYYYQTVPSWSWFYPFHYSPFLTDITVPDEPFVFQVSRPFRPYEQLMGVLPPKTHSALPKCLHPLMLEANSPICDYFPCEFVIDLVGKKFAWLGEVLLPFIDSQRLLMAMGDYHSKLTAEQTKLNKVGCSNLYISKYGPLGRKLLTTQKQQSLTKQSLSTEALEKLSLKKENYTLNLASFLNLNNQEHEIAGKIVLLMQSLDSLQFRFDQPSGLRHDISLKEGIEYSALEEIGEDFVSRTNKKSYGGERFVRVVERSLQKRLQNERRKNVFLQRTQGDRVKANYQGSNRERGGYQGNSGRSRGNYHYQGNSGHQEERDRSRDYRGHNRMDYRGQDRMDNRGQETMNYGQSGSHYYGYHEGQQHQPHNRSQERQNQGHDIQEGNYNQRGGNQHYNNSNNNNYRRH